MYPPNGIIQLVLADGSAIVRAGIKRLLADVPQIHIAAECADADAALGAITQHRPDVVIMDFQLGTGTAVDLLRLCAATSPRPICVVHTLDTAASTRAISYAAGADVFYDKGKDLAPLVGMLRKLAGCMVDGDTRVAA